MQLVTLDVLAPFPARLLAARLGAEGIVWQLRGESSVYPFGSVEVLVEADHADRAREVAGLAPLPLDERPQHPAGEAGDRTERAAATARSGRHLAQACWWLAVLAIVVGLTLRVAHIG